MTIFRLPSPVAGLRSTVPVASLLALGVITILFAVLAAPAGAVVTTVGPTTAGVQPRANAPYLEELIPANYANPSGNPVLHGTNTWAIYWDPTDHYHGDWQNVIDTYFHEAGVMSGSLGTNFSVGAQYTDKSNKPAQYAQVFRGAYTDTHAYPESGCTDPQPLNAKDLIGPEVAGKHTPVCLTNAQMATELEGFISSHGLPKGMNNVYYLLTPLGVTVCLDPGGATGHCSDHEPSEESYNSSFCSYHGDVNPGGLPTGDANTILYGVIPWTAGGLGDPHLVVEDQTEAVECQDAGLDPTSKPVYKPEVKPHEQQPNQLSCPTSDGGCDRGLADLIINQIGMEQLNIVTNPLLNAWQDSARNENTDECRFLFAPIVGGSVSVNEETGAGTLANQTLGGHVYYINDAFNLAALRLPYPGVPCINHVNLDPKFTSPNTVNVGETVSFNGMESEISLDAAFGYSSGGSPQPNYATYTWNFGDGTPPVTGYAPGAPACEVPWLSPCAASALHSYQYGGNYEVTLKVVDVAGNAATTANEVTVIGPPPPPPPPPPASSGSGSGSGAGGSGGGSSAGVATVPPPVAAAAVISKKIRAAVKGGVVVRYSVNEQVAGRFEVLLSRGVARRLGISGTPAVGLPQGTPPQLVIAKAFVVTTAGGRSTVKLQFSKRTGQRLARLHRVTLMLRLAVRNSSHSPTTATVLSTFTLTH